MSYKTIEPDSNGNYYLNILYRCTDWPEGILWYELHNTLKTSNKKIVHFEISLGKYVTIIIILLLHLVWINSVILKMKKKSVIERVSSGHKTWCYIYK